MSEPTSSRGRRWKTIPKTAGSWVLAPNLVDYERARAEFTWSAARQALDGLPEGRGLNIAHEAVDRHAVGALGSRVALRLLSKDGARHDMTYRDLRDETNRFANVLRALGVGKGDRVAALAGRIPELYVAALGTLKNRSVFTPLFSAFGPEPIQSRIAIAQARVLVTTEALYRKKVEAFRAAMPSLDHVLLVGDVASVQTLPRVRHLRSLMSDADAHLTIAPTNPDDPALLHFTSGTTGKPKGALHVHEAVVAHHTTARFALDFHAEDIYWCTADPGWVTGTSYGIIAPLTHGLTSIVDESDFDADRWLSILQTEHVTVWYTAPTAIRMLMKLGTAAVRQHRFPDLRFLASVGEPLNPEAVVWGVEAFGKPFHDNWWQTETGGIMIANLAAMDVRPGSMGRPLPGIDAFIVRRIGPDEVAVVDTPNTEGELALRPGWPSMFRGYLSDEARYRACFAGGYYLTGDLATRDEDGYFWFIGRADDVIKSSGHLIGPFEVESALMEHPAVAEVGVIGTPDPVALEVVKAFVALKPGYAPSDTLQRELLGFARVRLGAAIAPKEIVFQPSIPKNRAGKIMRRLLKARELGWPEGDTSTLET